MGLFPEAVRHRSPFPGRLHAFVRKFLGAFQVLVIRTFRLTLFHDLRQSSRVIQHRAGAQYVLIPGLVVVISHKQRRTVRLQQSLFADIGIRVVDEGAGLDIPVGIDFL